MLEVPGASRAGLAARRGSSNPRKLPGDRGAGACCPAGLGDLLGLRPVSCGPQSCLCCLCWTSSPCFLDFTSTPRP